MGTYYYLSCQQCGQYVHFGKMLHTQERKVYVGNPGKPIKDSFAVFGLTEE